MKTKIEDDENVQMKRNACLKLAAVWYRLKKSRICSECDDIRKALKFDVLRACLGSMAKLKLRRCYRRHEGGVFHENDGSSGAVAKRLSECEQLRGLERRQQCYP
jgi:hypothetical protein